MTSHDVLRTHLILLKSQGKGKYFLLKGTYMAFHAVGKCLGVMELGNMGN